MYFLSLLTQVVLIQMIRGYNFKHFFTAGPSPIAQFTYHEIRSLNCLGRELPAKTKVASPRLLFRFFEQQQFSQLSGHFPVDVVVIDNLKRFEDADTEETLSKLRRNHIGNLDILYNRETIGEIVEQCVSGNHQAAFTR